MKTFFYTVLVLFTLVACTQKESKFATITGKYTDQKGDFKEIHLCEVKHGTCVKLASSKIGADGYFGFTYSIDKPGIYVINVVLSEQKQPVLQDHNLKRFYLESGTTIEIELNDGDYRLLHSNSKKNDILTDWNLQIDTIFTYSHGFRYKRLSYKDFFPIFPGFVEQAEKFKNEVNSGDADFDELMKLMIDTDVANAALTMIYTPRTQHPPEGAEFPAYYKEVLSVGKPQSSRLLELPNALGYINLFTMYAVVSQRKDLQGREFFYARLDAIPNELLKGYYAVENLRHFKSYDATFRAFKEKITPYLQNDYLQKKLKDYEIGIREFESGAEGFDFSGKDAKGKLHKLSDYKGTLVYVDVWATWCGPCKKQIPALKELEKKLHGKAITFLSISVDKPQDTQKWVNFIKENELGGVQLIADKAFESDVTQVYQIKGIPRFMLFDKEGKVISIDAPRPSEQGTESWLRSFL